MVSTPRGRPSRAAAVSATKQLSKSKAEWSQKTMDTDSDEYSDDNVSSDEESSDEETIARGCRGREPPKKRAKQHESDSSGESDYESDSEGESDPESSNSEEEDVRLQRARKKQAEALALAKASKKKPAMKKMPPKKGNGGEKKAANIKKGKKFDDSSSDEEDDHDPMKDIDMDRLIKEAMEGSQMSILHSLCWWRIILDEAHCIKSRSSGTANAAFSLIGIHRWCLSGESSFGSGPSITWPCLANHFPTAFAVLSGTPLQNRVGELYSLIRFLRIDPMAHYFCRAKVNNCAGRLTSGAIASHQRLTLYFNILLFCFL